MSLVPDFVTELTVAPECIPCSAFIALVSTRNSCSASGNGRGRFKFRRGCYESHHRGDTPHRRTAHRRLKTPNRHSYFDSKKHPAERLHRQLQSKRPNFDH